MKIKELADKTRYFKETPEGVEYMCKAMEDRITDERVRFAVKLRPLTSIERSLSLSNSPKVPSDFLYCIIITKVFVRVI